MLHFFRQRGLSNVLYGAIIVATILTFVIEFRPNAATRTASLSEACVARVRGRCIGPKDFAAAYRMLNPARSTETSRRMSLKRAALDGLVERELLDDEAQRLGIMVTDDEVTDQLYDGFVRISVPAADPTEAQKIMQGLYQSYARAGIVPQDVALAHLNDRDTAIPVDFRDSKTKMFDMKVYERQVRNLSNRSTAEFREGQVRELLAAKMRDIVRDPIRVSQSEAWDEYGRRYSTATVAWIAVKESWASRWATREGPSDLDSWVKGHQAEFDKALADRLADDAPKAGHFRHILVKLPYGASDDEKALALGKLSWAAARIKAGQAFAEVARDVSDDSSSASRGGDLGDTTDGLVAPFKAAADALKPGETTAGAVETQFGYHLITKDDPARASEVEAQVRRGLPQAMAAKAQATEAANAIAMQIKDAMTSGKDAGQAITEAIAPLLRIGRTDALRVLPIAKGPGGRSGQLGPAFDGADASTQASAAAPVGRRFDAGTDSDRPQVQTSSAFNHGGDPFAGLSPDGTAQVVGFAFSSKEGDVMGQPVRTPDGFVVVQLKTHKIATRDEFEKDRDAFQDELVRAKRDEALSVYVKRLREQAKGSIKIDESYVQEARADGGASADDEDEDPY
ncbi:MAG: peptidylprolyl isomerase [Polyangiaceae bacterium]|jgi:peptidyl-prolyl cis-trans isomerase D